MSALHPFTLIEADDKRTVAEVVRARLQFLEREHPGEELGFIASRSLAQGDRILKLEAQRDELLAVLRKATFEGLTKHHNVPKLIPSEALRVALVDARAAIAKAEGGAA